ncbi:unnamed protein product [Closterium sp. NIES-54]
MASLSSLDSDSLSAPLPTPPSTCLLPPFSFPSSQASIPDLAYLALPCPAAAGLLASSLLPLKHAVILACPPCGTPLCALFPSALSPTPLLLRHRYALPPSAARNLASHPSPRAACAHTSPSARASGMLQRAHDNSSLFLDAPWCDVHLSHSCRASTHIHTALQVRALPSSLPLSQYLFLRDAVARPSLVASSRLPSPRVVGNTSSSASLRLPPPRAVGGPSPLASSRVPPPRAVGGSPSAPPRLPPPSVAGDPSPSVSSRSPLPRATGASSISSSSSSSLAESISTSSSRCLPSIPRRPPARSHGSLVAGRLPGSDLMCRSAPRPPARTPTGVTRSARYAALLGERVGDLPRSLERLPRDGERSRREYCMRSSWRSMSPASSLVCEKCEQRHCRDTKPTLLPSPTPPIPAFTRVASPNPRTYIGAGKVEEVRAAVAGMGVETVVFDDELSAGQLRNLEKEFGGDVRVCDRTALIIDIFSQRANTKEATLQVPLAGY